jgi:hypothetical protein
MEPRGMITDVSYVAPEGFGKLLVAPCGPVKQLTRTRGDVAHIPHIIAAQ